MLFYVVQILLTLQRIWKIKKTLVESLPALTIFDNFHIYFINNML